mmetsp:Transcript_23541/g.49701  ORF Transcript_23541/g.49701 Transcript_23541/m.49701 type:complete len:260 (+) Transcript_23541:257-1036(+)
MTPSISKFKKETSTQHLQAQENMKPASVKNRNRMPPSTLLFRLRSRPLPSIPMPSLLLLLFLLTTLSPSKSSSLSEYCSKESTDLGTCLGKQQQYVHLDLTLEQIEKCLECSGNFTGNESCSELKALNYVDGDGETAVDGADVGVQVVEVDGENNDVNAKKDAGFCQTYNQCVEDNCPRECWPEQDRWLECLVIELDCDWTCPRGVEKPSEWTTFAANWNGWNYSSAFARDGSGGGSWGFWIRSLGNVGLLTAWMLNIF